MPCSLARLHFCIVHHQDRMVWSHSLTHLFTRSLSITELLNHSLTALLGAVLQAQHMVMDTLALAVSASANYFLRYKEAQRMMLPLVAFPICGLLDLFCIYHELKAVQLRSLNRERAEMVAQHWLEQGKVGAHTTTWPHTRHV